ncbi:hypothetical protein I3842_12G003800 [Carya illinoinensis]|uniref:Uncharacterized protein n=1 Tax=Carya illinoinensis TaxID=32201 RepID=A0A922DFA2_CARIL|nr:hypothetical protein I3842_12G003800 [Carya illinoinensis]
MKDRNFWGSAYTTRFALPYLGESRGKIIALASAPWLPTPRMSFYNESKAAIVIFYETLRVEIGPEIRVTIVTPGFIESEMTQGKFLLKEGKMREVDQDLRDVQLSAIPVETAGACAAAIVKSACRGDRYLTEPAWFKVIYFWKVFFPEVIEWCYRLMYMNSSPQEAPSKKILDLTGAKNILYPSTLHTSEIKTD